MQITVAKQKKADMEHASRTGLSAAVSKRAKKRQLNWRIAI